MSALWPRRARSALVAALALGSLAAPAAASAQDGSPTALKPLRSWGAKTAGDATRGLSDSLFGSNYAGTGFSLDGYGALAAPVPVSGGKCAEALGIDNGSHAVYDLSAGPDLLIPPVPKAGNADSMGIGPPSCGWTGGPPPVDMMQWYLFGDGGPSAGASVAAGARYSRSRRVTLSVSAPRGTRSIQVSSSRSFAGARTFPASQRRIPWTLRAGVRPRVWVRYVGAPAGTPPAVSDGILVDSRAPSGSAVARRHGARVRILATASDGVSGVSRMQVRVGKRAGAWKPYRRSVVAKAPPGTWVSVRFRDRAGNVSRFRGARPIR